MYFQMQENQNEQEVLKIMTKRRNVYILAWVIAIAVLIVLDLVSSLFLQTEELLEVYNVFLILTGICGLASAVCASLVVWCINNIRYVKSHGTKQGGGLLWLIFFLLGGIIIPIIIVVILRNITKLGYKALGVQ